MSASEPQLPTFDLYRELEVHPDASPETIEAAWRSLAKRNHPDANPTIAIDRIRRMNIAHDWLSDPALRARYDSRRKQHRKRTPPKASSTESPSKVSKITTKELETLRAKAQGHDDYLAALRMWRSHMAGLRLKGSDEADCYERAVMDLADCVVRVVADRIDREDDHR